MEPVLESFDDGFIYEIDYGTIIDSKTIHNFKTIQDYTQYNYSTTPHNTYWYDRLVAFANNNMYHDEARLTNIQYYRIIAFLNAFI
jgi:hypothetical protein